MEIKSKELKEALEAAADEHYETAFVVISGKEYGFRAVTRKEWRKMMAERNAKLEAAGEDIKAAVEIQEDEIENLVELCLVHPIIPVDRMLAGVVDTLSNEILALSGFAGADFEAVKL